MSSSSSSPKIQKNHSLSVNTLLFFARFLDNKSLASWSHINRSTQAIFETKLCLEEKSGLEAKSSLKPKSSLEAESKLALTSLKNEFATHFPAMYHTLCEEEKATHAPFSYIFWLNAFNTQEELAYNGEQKAAAHETNPSPEKKHPEEKVAFRAIELQVQEDIKPSLTDSKRTSPGVKIASLDEADLKPSSDAKRTEEKTKALPQMQSSTQDKLTRKALFRAVKNGDLTQLQKANVLPCDLNNVQDNYGFTPLEWLNTLRCNEALTEQRREQYSKILNHFFSKLPDTSDSFEIIANKIRYHQPLSEAEFKSLLPMTTADITPPDSSGALTAPQEKKLNDLIHAEFKSLLPIPTADITPPHSSVALTASQKKKLYDLIIAHEYTKLFDSLCQINYRTFIDVNFWRDPYPIVFEKGKYKYLVKLRKLVESERPYLRNTTRGRDLDKYIEDAISRADLNMLRVIFPRYYSSSKTTLQKLSVFCEKYVAARSLVLPKISHLMTVPLLRAAVNLGHINVIRASQNRASDLFGAIKKAPTINHAIWQELINHPDVQEIPHGELLSFATDRVCKNQLPLDALDKLLSSPLTPDTNISFLSTAISAGRRDVLEKVLTHPKFKKNLKKFWSAHARQFLDSAIANDQPFIVQYLFTVGPIPLNDNLPFTPLGDAIMQRRVEIVKILLEQKADPHKMGSALSEPIPLIFIATRLQSDSKADSDKRIQELLCDHPNIDFNKKNARGHSVISMQTDPVQKLFYIRKMLLQYEKKRKNGAEYRYYGIFAKMKSCFSCVVNQSFTKTQKTQAALAFAALLNTAISQNRRVFNEDFQGYLDHHPAAQEGELGKLVEKIRPLIDAPSAHQDATNNFSDLTYRVKI